MGRVKRKVLAPIEARTEQQMIDMPRDNLSFPSWWFIFNHPGEVVVCQQRNGESPTGTVRMPRGEFDRLVRWYTTGRATKR